jgi:pimeloyl-ACP methyl ester carboxylesterase
MSSKYFATTELLKPPTERAAFSDRQAYVCAELSKLAYFKFEGGHTLGDALKIAGKIFGDDARLKILEEQLKLLLTASPAAEQEARDALRAILQEAQFSLVETFVQQGTEAFLCSRAVLQSGGSPKSIAYLVFRGTEPGDFRDIRTDVRASLEKVKSGDSKMQLHSGYLAAFNHVKPELEASLSRLKCDQLILTGHSLGGALAIVATRLLAADSTGACYTFGAPPIGAVDVQDGLKTPVYEIVNETDIVPRLPNPWLSTAIAMLLRLMRIFAKAVTFLNSLLANGTWDERLEAFIEAMTKYRHPGYISYLVGSGSEARLRFNVDGFDRLWWWLKMIGKEWMGGFKKMVGDHSIDLYIDKLRVHALRRQ